MSTCGEVALIITFLIQKQGENATVSRIISKNGAEMHLYSVLNIGMHLPLHLHFSSFIFLFHLSSFIFHLSLSPFSSLSFLYTHTNGFNQSNDSTNWSKSGCQVHV